MSNERRDADILLEKVIKITEDNLKAQSEYLRELSNLKNQVENKFDFTDRDHKDIKKNIDHTVNNTFAILNKMNTFSNENILKKIETLENLYEDLINNLKNFNTKYDSYQEKFNTFPDIQIDIKDIKSKVISSDDSFSLIKKILGGILLASVGINIIFGIWKNAQNSDIKADIKKIVKEEFKKGK